MKKVFFFLLTIVTYNGVTAQNVGIGTSTPTDKLHVAGNIKADTIKPNGIKLTPNAGNGKILISDAAGVGTWQASSNLAAAGNIGYGVWGDCATNGNISEYQPVTDATGEANDRFGNSVSISGNYAIVGANANQGSASIFHWDGKSWVLMQTTTDAAGAAGDDFGYSVFISDDYAIIGARSGSHLYGSYRVRYYLVK
jgi:FG-GAP repeat